MQFLKALVTQRDINLGYLTPLAPPQIPLNPLPCLNPLRLITKNISIEKRDEMLISPTFFFQKQEVR